MRGRVDQAAKILGLSDYLDRYPRQLSGGQRQRVAMGRAIVRDPQVFLFDEPLSNLDAKLRVQMRTEIKELHQRLKTTSVYVTHDQIEAMTMADKIVVMNGGNVEQIGTPLGLYDDPGQPVRGRLHRLAGDELPGRQAGPQRGAAPGHARRRQPAAGAGPGAGRRPRGHAGRAARAPGHRRRRAWPPRSWWSSPPAPTLRCIASSSDADLTVVSRERHTFRPGDTIRLQPLPGKTYLVRRRERQAPRVERRLHLSRISLGSEC